jgi:L-fuconolactonase
MPGDLSAAYGARTGHAQYAVVNYEQAIEPFLKIDRLSDSERAMLMGGACAKAYRWSPKKE